MYIVLLFLYESYLFIFLKAQTIAGDLLSQDPPSNFVQTTNDIENNTSANNDANESNLQDSVEIPSGFILS